MTTFHCCNVTQKNQRVKTRVPQTSLQVEQAHWHSLC